MGQAAAAARRIGRAMLTLSFGTNPNLLGQEPSMIAVMASATVEDALTEIARVLDTSGMFVYETYLAQLLAQPRSDRQGLPWKQAPSLTPDRILGLWATRRKTRSNG